MTAISWILSSDGRIFGLLRHFAECSKSPQKMSVPPVSPQINLDKNGLLAACSFLSPEGQKEKLRPLLPPFLPISSDSPKLACLK